MESTGRVWHAEVLSPAAEETVKHLGALEGSRQVKPFLDSEKSASIPAFSPDVKYVAYQFQPMSS